MNWLDNIWGGSDTGGDPGVGNIISGASAILGGSGATPGISGGGAAGFNWGSLLKPAASAAGAYINTSRQGNAASGYANYLQSQNDANYQNALAQHSAYQDYLNQIAPIQAANAAAARANAAARASAAAATERNRQGALKKGLGAEKQYYGKAQALLAPYVASGNQTLANATNLYQQGSDRAGALAAYLDQMKPQPTASQLFIPNKPTAPTGGA